MDVFSGLSHRQITNLVGSPTFHKFAPGDHLFIQGEPTDHLGLLIKGEVELIHGAGDKQERLAVLGSNEILGISGLISPEIESNTSARALSDGEILMVPADTQIFRERLGSDLVALQVLQNLICLLAEHLRKLNENFTQQNHRHIVRSSGFGPSATVLERIQRSLPKKGFFRKMESRSKLPPGQLLIRQGDAPDGFYYIHSGDLRAVRSEPGRETQPLRRITGPDVVGELGFFSGQPRAASVATLTDVTYSFFPGEEYEKLKAKEPAQALEILTAAAQVVAYLILEKEAQWFGDVPAVS